MLVIEPFVVRYTATNCYLVYNSSGREGIVIDPGDRSAALWQRITERGLKVTKIINTHGHIDHIGGNDWLRELTGAAVFIHPADRRCYGDVNYNCSYISMPTVVKDADGTITEGDVIDVGGVGLRVIHTPGHSPGSICLLAPGALFCGDTLFAGSVGRTDFPGGSEPVMLNSLREKIMTLPDDLAVYPGHGPSTQIGTERRNNPFLQFL
ncbi:MAG: MBL fold metallo-hydrolase [Thermoanaerobacteraceae bacterium]|nr:MBL fold metallo-hydrolase [Thermoanaerobacteraceae bacterium]